MTKVEIRQKAEAIVRRVRGSDDAPGFEACVNAEVRRLGRGYDQKCEALAQHFLADTDIPAALVPDLAFELQECAETFIAHENQRSSND